MAQREKVSFINKQGKRVVFWATRQADRAAKYGARKVSEYGKKKVPYKPYKTPAQRKAASKARTRKVQTKCPFCPRTFYFGGDTGKTRATVQREIYRHLESAHDMD